MDSIWLAYLLDKVILLAVLVWGGLALVFGWLVPATTLSTGAMNGRPTMPTPSLELDDVLLLVGVKEAQLAVLQRQLALLQDQVATDRAGPTGESPHA